jgi:hypothetical protein
MLLLQSLELGAVPRSLPTLKANFVPEDRVAQLVVKERLKKSHTVWSI